MNMPNENARLMPPAAMSLTERGTVLKTSAADSGAWGGGVALLANDRRAAPMARGAGADELGATRAAGRADLEMELNMGARR